MNLLQLPAELWSHIFELCREEGEQGYFVPQPTLATALRLSKTFFKLAGEVLYHDPIVHNLRNFVEGATDDFDASSAGNSTRFCSKLPLLNHVRRLTIAPSCHDGKYFRVSNIACEARQASERLEWLRRSGIVATPNLDSLSLGTYPSAMINSSEDHRLCLWFSGTRTSWDIRAQLFQVLRPNIWCEWLYDDYPREHQMPRVTSTSYIPKPLLPKIVNLHISSKHSRYCLVWGTTNRVVMPQETDILCHHSPQRWLSSLEQTRATGVLLPSIATDVISHFDIIQQIRHPDGPLTEVWLAEGILDKITQESRRLDLRTAAESITTLELFGLEKILGVLLSKSEMEELEVLLDGEWDYATSKGSDESSWAACREDHVSDALMAFRDELQKSALNRVEKAVHMRLQEALEHGSNEHNIENLVVRLYRAQEYTGCDSCGEGKEDRWTTMDHVNTASSYDESATEVDQSDSGEEDEEVFSENEVDHPKPSTPDDSHGDNSAKKAHPEDEAQASEEEEDEWYDDTDESYDETDEWYDDSDRWWDEVDDWHDNYEGEHYCDDYYTEDSYDGYEDEDVSV
ncbi:hypothetical protein IAT40_002628 [Kwoniella sp. CBS 6097]